MHEGGFKVRRHLKVRKYFHIYFPQLAFHVCLNLVTFYLALVSKAKIVFS